MSTIKDPLDEREPLRQEAWKWVLHVTSGDATKADIAELERWCGRSRLHAEAFATASGRWRAIGPAATNVILQSGGKPRAEATRGRGAIGRRAFLGGALVASAAGAVVLANRPPFGLWPSLNEFAADYRTGTGQRQQIALADSVSVDMNTQTSLNIRKTTGDRIDRIELIAGEAAIATASHQIEVVVADGRVSADSAHFNVRYDGAEVCVTCLGGRARVDQQGQSVTISQGEQASYGARGLIQATVADPVAVAGWREGDLFFRDQPLAHVIEEVNRYRPGKIVLMNEALGQRRVTAHFKLDRLDVVITQLRESFGAQVRALPGGLVVVS